MMVALIVGLSGAVFSAVAHPGPKILTVGGADERMAMTSGVSYEDVKGVHLIRGTRMLAGEEAAVRTTYMRRGIIIETVTRRRYAYPPRRLRTQGFYSGNGPKSRRYRQGFYSGR